MLFRKKHPVVIQVVVAKRKKVPKTIVQSNQQPAETGNRDAGGSAGSKTMDQPSVRASHLHFNKPRPSPDPDLTLLGRAAGRRRRRRPSTAGPRRRLAGVPAQVGPRVVALAALAAHVPQLPGVEN